MPFRFLLPFARARWAGSLAEEAGSEAPFIALICPTISDCAMTTSSSIGRTHVPPCPGSAPIRLRHTHSTPRSLKRPPDSLQLAARPLRMAPTSRASGSFCLDLCRLRTALVCSKALPAHQLTRPGRAVSCFASVPLDAPATMSRVASEGAILLPQSLGLEQEKTTTGREVRANTEQSKR